jgi:hypothetical protein
MKNFDIWKINLNIDYNLLINDFLDISDNLYLLNLQKSYNKYTLIEKIVYEIASYHINNINMNINENMFVEFWFKDYYDYNFHFDCDENIKKLYNKYEHPLLSCVTYLNEHDIPTILTDINYDDYKYKNFENKDMFIASFPKLGKQITFDPTIYHGIAMFYKNSNYDKRYILAINLWNKKPLNIEYYDYNTCIKKKYENIKDDINDTNINDTNINDTNIIEYNNIINIEKDNIEMEEINVSNKIINFDFFENLLYKNKKDLLHIFVDYIKDSKNHCFKFIKNDIEKNLLYEKLKNKYDNILDDYNKINNQNNLIIYNRFLQRFQYNKIYTPDICKWIVDECEHYALYNNGWMKKRHSYYATTDLPIDNIKTIFNYIMTSLNTITSKIEKAYNLNNNVKLNYKDIFVVKYKYDEQCLLDMHQDGYFISFQILLSDTKDFEGGGTYFDDGLIMKPEQGDLIIHSGKIKHSGLPIKSGCRYLLVGFIDLLFL